MAPLVTPSPMTDGDIEWASHALAQLLRATVPPAAAAEHLARTAKDPSAAQWRAIAARLSSGASFASELQGRWPAGFVAAVHAGEDSGQLPEVLERIRERLALARDIRAQARRLLYPLSIIGVALLMAAAILYFAVPLVANAASISAADSIVVAVSHRFAEWINRWGLIGGMVMGGGLIWAANYLPSPDGRNALVGWGLRLPRVGDSLRALYLGLWCHDLAMLHATGAFGVVDMLTRSAEILPTGLREAVRRMAGEVERYGYDGATSLDRLAENDPRRDWPFLLIHAFQLGQRTGTLADHLRAVAPELIDDGMQGIARAVGLMHNAAVIFAASLLISLFAALYSLPLSQVMEQL